MHGILRNTKQMSPKFQRIYILVNSIFFHNTAFRLQGSSCASVGGWGRQTRTKFIPSSALETA